MWGERRGGGGEKIVGTPGTSTAPSSMCDKLYHDFNLTSIFLASFLLLQVTLLGQNVDAYGRDMSPRHTFAELLHYVSDVPGIERVRFVTSHPRYMSLRVVDAVANLPSMAECFMVPFQSGDNEVRIWACGWWIKTYPALSLLPASSAQLVPAGFVF